MGFIMQKYKVAILGLGAIFDRHLLAIEGNSEHFKLIGVSRMLKQN